jgi:multimeric flavodoxin WrbA
MGVPLTDQGDLPDATTLEDVGQANAIIYGSPTYMGGPAWQFKKFADACSWRVAFAFDHRRQGILLVAGDKSGMSQGRFYKQLIATADKRFAAHLERLKKASASRG